MSMRRTRAMGLSPGGAKALDINAPTRKPRKTKASSAAEDATAHPTTSAAPTARSSKRKIEADTNDKEHPSKKTRRARAAVAPKSKTKSQAIDEVVAAGYRHHISAPREEESTSEAHVSETDAEIPARIEQQPTPPAELSEESSTRQSTSSKSSKSPMRPANVPVSVPKNVEKDEGAGRRLSRLINTVARKKRQDNEEEKALSDCDDDEFAARFPDALKNYNNTFNSTKKQNPGLIKWVSGSNAMFVVKDTNGNENAARGKGKPYAISASVDWFEKNPTAPIPTPAEMTSLLERFQQSKKPKSSETRTQKSSTTDFILGYKEDYLEPDAPRLKPRTPQRNLSDSPSSSDSHSDESMLDHEEDDTNKINRLAVENSEQTDSLTEPQIHLRQQPEPARGWASALSAGLIGNVLRTPVTWFTRRDRARHNPSATEPRPQLSRPNMSHSSRPRRKADPPSTVAHGNKLQPAKKRSSYAQVPPYTPTPSSSQPRRGRPDAHLPVHLRGARFEDLPTEWQAVSQHMKKAEATQKDDEVDLQELLRVAEKTREERRLRELLEKAEVIARQQEEDENHPGSYRAGEKRKRVVSFKQHKVYTAKLGPSTFGMPSNINDDSSEEDIEVEVNLSPLASRQRGVNNKTPTDLRLSPLQSSGEVFHETEDNDQEEEQEPAPKKVRTWNHHPSPGGILFEGGIYDLIGIPNNFNDPHRARPAGAFLFTPPKESARIEEARKEYERMRANGDRRIFMNSDPILQKQVAEMQGLHFLNEKENIFKQKQEEKAAAAAAVERATQRPTAIIKAAVEKRTKKEKAEIKQKQDDRKLEADKKRKLEAEKKRKLEAKKKRKPEAELLSKQQDEDVENRPTTELAENIDRDEEPELSETQPLQESSDTRLNKVREAALKYKPKVPSGLHNTQIMSPIADKRTLSAIFGDPEVVEAIWALSDDDIVPEGFKPVMAFKEDTVMREASKMLK